MSPFSDTAGAFVVKIRQSLFNRRDVKKNGDHTGRRFIGMLSWRCLPALF